MLLNVCVYLDFMSKVILGEFIFDSCSNLLFSGETELEAEPKILFLDEATSHLDILSEQRVNQYLKQKNITQISVAHRKETIEAADRVIDLTELISNVPRAQSA